MSVSYSGVALSPAPFVSINKRYELDNKGVPITPIYTITLNGTIVGNKQTISEPLPANPLAATFDNIVNQYNELRSIFSAQYSMLSISGGDGGINATCRVDSVNIQEGQWVQTAPYTITLTTDSIGEEEESSEGLREKSENWGLEEREDGTWIITHSLSATALIPFSSGAAILAGTLSASGFAATAREWCRDRKHSIVNGNLTGARNSFSDFIAGLPGSGYWNYAITENGGFEEASWQLTETFLHYPSGSAREEFSITVDETLDNPAFLDVSIAGTIFGLSDTDSDFNQKFINASGYFNGIRSSLITRVDAFAEGRTVNPNVVSRQVIYDRTAGSLRYSYNYKTQYTNLIENAVAEDIQITDTGKTDVFAEIIVPGRGKGPIIQNIGTTTAPSRSVSLSATIAGFSGSVTPHEVAVLRDLYLQKPNTDSIFDALKPEDGFFYVNQNEEVWNPITRRYARNVSWIMDLAPPGTTVAGIPSISGLSDKDETT